jgi:hypothetical protein
MKKIAGAVCGLLLLAGLSARAGAGEAAFGALALGGAEAPAVPPAMPAGGEGAPALKEWTVMAYLNTLNDLETFLVGKNHLNALEKVGSTDKVNVVAEFGRARGNAFDESDNWTGVRRYFVTGDAAADPNGYHINSRVLRHYDKADMGDWRHLQDFILWAKENYPAKRYLLIINSHGTGWKSNSAAPHYAKGISYDYYSGNHVTTEQLGRVFEAAGKIDVYVNDACLMMDAAVLYELGRHADYVVGSEETTSIALTFPDKLLARLAAEPEADGARAAGFAFESIEPRLLTQYSVARMAALEALPPLVNDFCSAASRSGERKLFKAALKKTVAFADPEYKDMGQFLSLVKEGAQDAELRASAGRLLDHLTGSLVARNVTAGKYGPARGVSFYFPETYLDPAFNRLKFARDINWSGCALLGK